jgi:hypothetical protein
LRALRPAAVVTAAMLLTGCSFFTSTEPEVEATPEPDYSHESISAPAEVTPPGTQLAFDDPARLVSLSYEAQLGFQLITTEVLDEDYIKELPGRSDEWDGLVAVVVLFQYETLTDPAVSPEDYRGDYASLGGVLASGEPVTMLTGGALSSSSQQYCPYTLESNYEHEDEWALVCQVFLVPEGDTLTAVQWFGYDPYSAFVNVLGGNGGEYGENPVTWTL